MKYKYHKYTINYLNPFYFELLYKIVNKKIFIKHAHIIYIYKSYINFLIINNHNIIIVILFN